jgi:hypothetical protein
MKLKIWQYPDDFDQENLPRSKWKYDYFITGLDKIISRNAMPRMMPVHLWYNYHEEKWNIQFCQRAYKVELIVKPEFKSEIKQLKGLPEEVSFFYRILILFAFVHNDYEEVHKIREKYFGNNDTTLMKSDE